MRVAALAVSLRIKDFVVGSANSANYASHEMSHHEEPADDNEVAHMEQIELRETLNSKKGQFKTQRDREKRSYTRKFG